MPDVTEATIEAETDYDYSYTPDYSYGLLAIEDAQTAIATASATTTATTTTSLSQSATSTATAATTATTLVDGIGAFTTTASTQTTAASVATSGATATSTALGTTTAASIVSDAAAVEVATDWRVTRDETTVEDAVYDVDPVVDTANPFGDYAVIKIDDRGGSKFEEYERGTRVDVAVSENYGITFTDRFTGYVVERRETEQSGADALEVEAYSFDQFLRRNTVSNDQTGNTISEALQDIIETDTPVSWDASNVNVGDNQELTRGYQGVKVENTLRDLAFKSNNEEFGVNDSLEFFFRPRETTHIDRGIDNTQWFNYDIPELGKQAINEVEVWFDGGNESVIVDDGTDKLDLQDNLNLPEPGTQRAELNRPLITDISDAEDIGRKYLQFRNATLSGTVTTFGLYEAEPGDTIDITITPRGIDGEFVIAGTEYRWGRDQTILTIIEKRGGQDGILTELNDSVQRVEMNGADRDAPKNRITTTNATALVDVSVDADGSTPSGVRFVNDGRRAVRDGWADISYPTIQNIVVGDDGSGLSRSNTSLGNQTASAAASESLPDAKSVEYSASITETGVEEIGLTTSSGTLIARAVFDSRVDLSGTVTVSLAVSNDDSVSRGVLTDDGQTAVRDVLADNSPNIPLDYGYGSDGTAVSETDTALGNELVSVALDEVLVQSADTQSEWESITSYAATTPITFNSDSHALAQTCFTVEGEDTDTTSGTSSFFAARFSGTSPTSGEGEALDYTGSGQTAEWSFTPQYTIPASDFELQIRFESNNSPALNFTLNGVTWEGINDGATVSNVMWRDFADPNTGGVSNGYTGGDLQAGTTYTLQVESTSSGGSSASAKVDVVAPLDGRYSYTFDNSPSTGSDDGRYLDGPELYPPSLVTALDTASTRRNTTGARFTSTWNDTSGSQYVEIANDGTNYERVSNADSGSVTFASPNDGLDTNLSLSRYGSRTTATPQTGYLGQSVDDWELYADITAVVSDDIQETLARAIVPPDTLAAGTTVREAGLKNGSTLLSRHELAAFDLISGQRLSSSETTAFSGDN